MTSMRLHARPDVRPTTIQAPDLNPGPLLKAVLQSFPGFLASVICSTAGHWQMHSHPLTDTVITADTVTGIIPLAWLAPSLPFRLIRTCPFKFILHYLSLSFPPGAMVPTTPLLRRSSLRLPLPPLDSGHQRAREMKQFFPGRVS